MNIRRIAATIPLAAALVVGGPIASAAADSPAPASAATESSDVGTADQWVYIEDFFWNSDCTAKGESMMREGLIRKFRCDGSESPFDDYSLFVVF